MSRRALPECLPTPLELDCLKALWALGEANGREVRSHLAHTRPLAYTTVMTVLDRLARKGGVGRRKVGRSFLYYPTQDRETLRQRAVRQVVESLFDGSVNALTAYLQAGDSVLPLRPGENAVERAAAN